LICGNPLYQFPTPRHRCSLEERNSYRREQSRWHPKVSQVHLIIVPSYPAILDLAAMLGKKRLNIFLLTRQHIEITSDSWPPNGANSHPVS
jgi:hypothetical protein